MFLSVLPVKINKYDQKKLAKSMAYFPVVGLLFGLILVGIYLILQPLVNHLTLSFILIITLVILDRGLHLDGLADTADGLLGGQNKEDILRIMKDSSVGAFGVAALVFVILGQFIFLSSIKPKFMIAALIFMPTLARYSVVYANTFFKKAKSDGLATSFNDNKIMPMTLASISMLALSTFLIWKLPSLTWPIVASISIMLFLPFLLTRKIDGVTGDIFGALIELNQLIILLLFGVFL